MGHIIKEQRAKALAWSAMMRGGIIAILPNGDGKNPPKGNGWCMSNYAKSHEWIFNEYHKTDNPVTKRSYLDILKTRANNGSTDAAKLVAKIQGAKRVWCRLQPVITTDTR